MPGAAKIRQILALALPIIGAMVSQNILNLVDTAMVGTLGDAAIGAVGMGSFMSILLLAFLTGGSTGVQAMVARRYGEGAHDGLAEPLNGGLAASVLIGIPLAVLGWFGAEQFFDWLTNDTQVAHQGVDYLQMRMLAAVAVGFNFSFRGYWSGIYQARIYMVTIIVMHVINIVLNWVLIFGHFGAPAMGVAGAGLGTTIATWIGAIMYLVLGFRHARVHGFLRTVPNRTVLTTMGRLAVPAGVQQVFFSAGMIVFYALVERIGTAELAATSVLVNLVLVAILPGIAFGIAAATFVGDFLGQNKPQEARQWGWDVAKVAAVGIALLAIPGLVVPDLLLLPFLRDPQTRALAHAPLQFLALMMPLDTAGLVLLHALQGAGDTRRVMTVAVIMQWGVGLPLVWLLGPTLGLGLLAVWVAYSGYRFIQGCIFAGIWAGTGWAKHQV